MKPIGNKSLEVGLLSNSVKPVCDTARLPTGNKNPETGLPGDNVRPIAGRNPETDPQDDTVRPIAGRHLEVGLLGRNNSARSADSAKSGYEQLSMTNSVVMWRGGRRGSSLGMS